MDKSGEVKKHTVNVLLDALVGENRSSIDINFITDGDVVTKNRHVLETSPPTDGAVPANDAGLYPGMVFNLAVLEQDTALKSDTVANDDIWANSDIWADAAVIANFCGGVHHDIATIDIGFGGRSEEFGFVFGERAEV